MRRLLRTLFPPLLICPLCCEAAPSAVDDMCPRCRKYYVDAPWLLQVKFYLTLLALAFAAGALFAVAVIKLSEDTWRPYAR